MKPQRQQQAANSGLKRAAQSRCATGSPAAVGELLLQPRGSQSYALTLASDSGQRAKLLPEAAASSPSRKSL